MATKTKKPSINLGGLARSNSSFSGIGIPNLTNEEAEKRKEKYGSNELAEGKKTNIFIKFLLMKKLKHCVLKLPRPQKSLKSPQTSLPKKSLRAMRVELWSRLNSLRTLLMNGISLQNQIRQILSSWLYPSITTVCSSLSQ